MKRVSGYQGSYLIGFVFIGVVILREFIFYQSNLTAVLVPTTIYGLFYTLDPWLSKKIHWHKYLYFPVQTIIVIFLTNYQPFSDFSPLLYVPLCIQAFREFSRKASLFWIILFGVLLLVPQIRGLGWMEGIVMSLLYFTVTTFLISYDILYSRTQADRVESQLLLSDLQSAHQKLQEYAEQAEELAIARERNRLARELHDSVNQTIFSITLTSQSARLLLDREPARVPEQIDQLQTMTEDALGQLRTLIVKLRPPESS